MKFFLKFIFSISLIIIFLIAYLSLIGFETSKFNNQISFKEVEKDQVYNDVYKISNKYDIYELSHDDFINNLIETLEKISNNKILIPNNNDGICQY